LYWTATLFEAPETSSAQLTVHVKLLVKSLPATLVTVPW